jgi:hypothetical protein
MPRSNDSLDSAVKSKAKNLLQGHHVLFYFKNTVTKVAQFSRIHYYTHFRNARLIGASVISQSVRYVVMSTDCIKLRSKALG